VEAYRKLASQEKSKKKYVELEEPEFRYCTHCEAFKPDRTHHCRECKRCVLMMDHHWSASFVRLFLFSDTPFSPWVNNCVGVNNRKDFVLFLFYATLSQAFAMGLLIARIVGWVTAATGKNGTQPPVLQIVLVALDFVFLLPVTIAVGGLLWYQVSCIVENLTTIDE
jgi:hypothetical protein